MRIAFLTPEYPSDLPDGGGLATYLHRMALLLKEFGHDPEIFLMGHGESETIFYDGILVHRIGWNHHPRFLRMCLRMSKRFIPWPIWNHSFELLLHAYVLARALETRHVSAPFDLVQSADYRATGLFVQNRSDRVQVVRCSSAADLYNSYNDHHPAIASALAYFERLTIRRAEFAYTPSGYLADYVNSVHNIKLGVIRPPAHIQPTDARPPPFAPPTRYFIHFGQLTERKGTGLLAEALPLAWKLAPDLTMVWSGTFSDPSKLTQWQSLWGDRACQVHITGALPRPQLYSLLQRADAAVLPSQVDNLPNTVIESLSLGIPVLGSRGASIDELVEEGETGHLVELGDTRGLAETLAKMWLKKSPVSKGFQWQSAIYDEMRPEQAVANLLSLYDRRQSCLS